MKTTSRKQKLNWKQKILRDFERVEEAMGLIARLKGDWPVWVANVWREFLKQALPRVDFAKWDDLGAYDTGRAVGVKYAALVQIAEFVEKPDNEAKLRELEAKKKMWSEEEVRKLEDKWERIGVGYERAIKRSLSLALDQEPFEAKRFFKGFSEMIQQNPSARFTTTTNIYLFMGIFWQWIQGLESARVFHEMLCKVFGSHLVGDQKRVQKICERVGLHFRGRGRPQKRNSDTPPV